MPKPSASGSILREIFAKIQNDALRLGAGARGKQDHGVVVRPGPHPTLPRLRGRVGWGRLARRGAGKLGKQSVRARSIAAAKPQPGHIRAGEQVLELQAVLIDDELRLQPRKNITELIAVHLDMHGADRRAGRQHAEIAEQLLDRVVGKQRDAVIAAEAACAQQRREAADGLA